VTSRRGQVRKRTHQDSPRAGLSGTAGGVCDPGRRLPGLCNSVRPAYATYHTSRLVPPIELVDRCNRTLDRCVRDTYALLMDLADVAGNVVDGAHVASTGGVWMGLTYGFAGMRDFEGELSFDPRLPRHWERLRFPLRFHETHLEVDITHQSVTLTHTGGQPLEVTVRGTRYTLEPGEPLVCR